MHQRAQAPHRKPYEKADMFAIAAVLASIATLVSGQGHRCSEYPAVRKKSAAQAQKEASHTSRAIGC